MAELDPKISEQLALALSGEPDLYNNIVQNIAMSQSEIQSEREKAAEWETKYGESQKQNAQYTGQIANLVSKLPIGGTQRPESYEDVLNKVASEDW